MFAIEVELLGGRYSATAYNDRESAEWPPHPARLFSALVAALHDVDPPSPEERDALLWLENQPAPAMHIDLPTDEGSGRRMVHNVAVPVNDLSVTSRIEETIREAESQLAQSASESDAERTPAEARRAKTERAKTIKNLNAAREELVTIDESPAAKAVKVAGALLPHRRTRQMRTFPVVIPSRSTFMVAWSSDASEARLMALDQLCKRVTRLGHSSTLVRCRVTTAPATLNLIPSATGEFVLRTVGPGQVERLEREHARHSGVDTRVLPALPQRYGRHAPSTEERPVPSGAFSNQWIVFERVHGGRVLSSRTTDLTRALRNALIEVHGARTLSGVLSGHNPDGSSYNKTHIAVVALPHVGSEFADATVQGLAIVLPRDIDSGEREQLLRLIAAWEGDRGTGADGILELGGEGFPPIAIKRIDVPSKVSLRASRWCRPSRRFISATPVALDRNPGNLRSNQEHTAHKAAVQAQGIIAESCGRIGLPRPSRVHVSASPLLQGTQHAAAFRPLPARQGRHPKVRIHAELGFDEDVRGPILLGAGRYFGLGLFLPVPEYEG